MKLAILNCPDTHCIESFAAMLATTGYETRLPSEVLRSMLRQNEMPYVVGWQDLRHMGYLEPRGVEEASLEDFYRCDLFADLKVNGCRKALATWTHLKGRVLWYRVQGGVPEVTVKGGDETSLPCPMLTANRWYDAPEYTNGRGKGRWSYVCWPPFVRQAEFAGDRATEFTDPVTLIHGVYGWGYGAIVNELRTKTGLKVHGAPSPDGCLENSQVPALLRSAMCYVQLRSNDSPGYAIYEAMSAGCPLVVPRRFITRMNVSDLFVEDITCFCFDSHDGECASEEWASRCVEEITMSIRRLKDPAVNKLLGDAIRDRFNEVVWTPMRDAGSFREFMRRHFP